jgi:hypothetical protein
VPYVVNRHFSDTTVTFAHYGLTKNKDGFASFVKTPSVQDWDRMFEDLHSDLVFFGHDHRAYDQRRKARYINPDPLGYGPDPVVRYCVVNFTKNSYNLEHKSVPYENGQLVADYERRAVPDREFILKVFFRK